jgi:hypothetical protein
MRRCCCCCCCCFQHRHLLLLAAAARVPLHTMHVAGSQVPPLHTTLSYIDPFVSLLTAARRTCHASESSKLLASSSG